MAKMMVVAHTHKRVGEGEGALGEPFLVRPPCVPRYPERRRWRGGGKPGTQRDPLQDTLVFGGHPLEFFERWEGEEVPV